MKIYIAGKYTGLGHANAVAKFNHTEQQLIAAGISPFDIVNPMKLGIAEDELWSTAIEICLHHLKRCDAIFIQLDWRESFGARREITEAMMLDMPLYFEDSDDLKRLVKDYLTETGCLQTFTYQPLFA